VGWAITRDHAGVGVALPDCDSGAVRMSVEGITDQWVVHGRQHACRPNWGGGLVLRMRAGVLVMDHL